MKPIVSIIITTYNSSEFLAQSIKSALDQKTCFPYEVVLVDDGSTDNTINILASIRHPLLRNYFNHHAGQGAAKNFAIKHSRGEIIIILDSDDYLSLFSVERVVEYFKKNRNIFYAYSEHFGVDKDGKIIFRTNKADYLLKNCCKYKEDLILHCCFHGHLMAMRKEIFLKVGYFNDCLKVGVDYEWILRFCDSYKAGYIPRCLYYYRKHNKGTNLLIDNNYRCIEEIIEKALARKKIFRSVYYQGRDRVGYRIYGYKNPANFLKVILLSSGVLKSFHSSVDANIC